MSSDFKWQEVVRVSGMRLASRTTSFVVLKVSHVKSARRPVPERLAEIIEAGIKDRLTTAKGGH